MDDAIKPYFIEPPFLNWTRNCANMVGVICDKLKVISTLSNDWNGKVVSVRFIDAKDSDGDGREHNQLPAKGAPEGAAAPYDHTGLPFAAGGGYGA